MGRPKAPKPGLRMGELVEATGLPRSTLAHYIREGLLPAPVKTSRNMAYYSEECVERAALIRALQARHLPLQKIRQYVELSAKGYDPAPIMEVDRRIFGEGEEPKMGREAFCSRTGLSREQTEALVGEGLLLPLAEGEFGPADVEAGRAFRRLLEAGLSPGDLKFYRHHAEGIVEREMALRSGLTRALAYEADAALTSELVGHARVLRSYVIDRVFQQQVAASQRRRFARMLSGEEGPPCT